MVEMRTGSRGVEEYKPPVFRTESELQKQAASVALQKRPSSRQSYEGLETLVPMMIKLQNAFAMIKARNQIELP